MDYEQLLSQAERALVGLDAEALVGLYAPKCLLVDIPSGIQMTERSALKSYYDQLFALRDIAFTDVSFFSVGDRAAGEWTWRGRSSKSGNEFAIRGASLFKLSEEGIIEELLFYDPRSAQA